MLRTLAGPGFYRLVLSLLVFVHHVSRFSIGSAAVYMFFSLSGFWICSMWSTRYSRARRPYLTFITSRVWRLAPVFLMCSAIAWVVAIEAPLPVGLNRISETFSSIFILGYSSLPFMPDVPAWSLDYEMQFYLIAPALVAATLLNWRIALVASAMISGAAYFADCSGLVLPCLFLFAMGAAAASARWYPSLRLAILFFVFTCAVLLVIAASPYRDLLLGGAHPGTLHRYNEHLNVIVAILMFPLTIYTTRQRGGNYDRMFGDLSFIIYLLHWPVIHALDISSGTYQHRLFQNGIAFFYVVGLSWLVWKFVDRPFNELRSRWVHQRIPAVNSAQL